MGSPGQIEPVCRNENADRSRRGRGNQSGQRPQRHDLGAYNEQYMTTRRAEGSQQCTLIASFVRGRIYAGGQHHNACK